jgi:hypothetical protein
MNMATTRSAKGRKRTAHTKDLAPRKSRDVRGGKTRVGTSDIVVVKEVDVSTPRLAP